MRAATAPCLSRFWQPGWLCSATNHGGTLADAANNAGFRTVTDDFGSPASASLLADVGGADLILVNHAMAHVDDLDEMAAALARSLAPTGTIAVEFHDLAGLLAGGQFDILGHAHRSYLSLTSLQHVLTRHGLHLAAARRSSVHGGAIQALATLARAGAVRRTGVDRLLARDAAGALQDPLTYARFGERATTVGARLRRHLEAATDAGRLIAGYGAPGRAVGLLAVAGVGPALLPFTVDRDPLKQGLSLPGSAIPVRDVDAIDTYRPDEVLILAWTWASEIAGQLGRVGSWGGRMVVPLPRLRTVAAKRVRPS